MKLFSAARRGVWKCRWFLAGACFAAVIVPAVSRGQRSEVAAPVLIADAAPIQLASQLDPQASRPADPLEALKQGLQLDAGKNFEMQARRKKMIESALAELKSITQLRKAYFLHEWDRLELDIAKESDNQRYRKQIGERLTQAISQSAQVPDVEQKIAAALWIADLAGNQQDEQRDLARDQFARAFTGVVLKLLKEKDVSVRQAALHALGRITPRPAEVFPALKTTLEKDELGPRRLAAFAMTDLARNVKGHVRLEQLEVMDKVLATASFSLRDADESVRGYSLLAILEAASAFSEYVGVPGEKLTVEVQDKRALAPDLQKVLKTFQTTMPQLLQALNDAKVKVRLTALQTLGQVCSARAKIVQELRDLDKLALVKHESAGALLQAYAAPDPLAGIVERDWTYITRLLRDDDERVRRGAIEFLEILGEQVEPALPEITQALRDPSPFVRWTAARVLRNVPAKKVSHDAVRALAFLLMDADPDVSKAAAHTLEALGPYAGDAVAELGHMIANTDPENRAWDADNRLAAMKALVAIGPERTTAVIPQLILALADQDPRIRRQAAETLGLYGAAARAAVPALWQALRDDDGEVRLHASEAIMNIKSGKK